MKKKSNLTGFKEDLKRLEEIAGLLDRDELDLEKAIQLYEEGVVTSKKCLEILKEAELKITNLNNEFNLIETESGENIFKEDE